MKIGSNPTGREHVTGLDEKKSNADFFSPAGEKLPKTAESAHLSADEKAKIRKSSHNPFYQQA